MSVPLQPSKVLILLLASCLIWTGGISLAVAFFLGSAVTTGWIIAGALVLAVLVWCGVMFREVRHAIELPDYLAEEKTQSIATQAVPNASSMAFRAELRAAFERSGLEERRAGRRSRRRSRDVEAAPGQTVGKR